MICKNCGAQTADNAAFCSKCGAPVQEQPQNGYYEPEYIPVRQPVTETAGPDATPIFVLGILSLALPALGGLICAIICRKKVKEYLANGGKLTGLAKVGNILSIVGLAVSIFTCVYITIYLFIVFAIYGTAIFTMMLGALSNSARY
ncbi:MAG: zinc ribbon domain-containing protein [Clostridia bacterium]|nr:zinc ribbon domain-containing protein [Clostridia bacterium]